MIKNLNKKKKGFTLVELIVVIAIIGILAAISVPKYSQYKEAAYKRANQATAKLLAEATLMASEAGDIDIPALSANVTYDKGGTAKTDYAKIILYLSEVPKNKEKDGDDPKIAVDVTAKTITATVGNQTHPITY